MRDDIIKLAREAGMNFNQSSQEFRTLFCDGVHAEDLERFYNLAVQHEREAIAKMFDEPMHLIPFVQNDLGGCLICGFTPKMAADHIRAIGEKQ